MSIPGLEDCVLDHIAIGVKDIEASVSIYEALGLKFADQREVVEEQKVKTAFAPIDKNGHIELLEPTDESSSIHKYIEKKGPGIHHICFRVADVISKHKELASKGFHFIYESPQKGAGNCLVNFIHPKSTGGVLIEISQKMES
jgi:methylmalonyl-CoA/ethylmalonyl-CoA epimerase